MRLYKIMAHTDDAKDDVVQWVGTQADAAKLRKELNSEQGFKRDNINTFEVDVPTDKKGLLEFLNANAH
jgi:hypothetical protein